MPDRVPGSDGFSSAILLSQIENLRELVTEQHGRLRSDMSAGFADVRTAFSAHEKEDRAVEKRVTTIEIERQAEEKQSMKRASWVSLIMAGAVTAVVEIIKASVKTGR